MGNKKKNKIILIILSVFIPSIVIPFLIGKHWNEIKLKLIYFYSIIKSNYKNQIISLMVLLLLSSISFYIIKQAALVSVINTSIVIYASLIIFFLGRYHKNIKQLFKFRFRFQLKSIVEYLYIKPNDYLGYKIHKKNWVPTKEALKLFGLKSLFFRAQRDNNGEIRLLTSEIPQLLLEKDISYWINDKRYILINEDESHYYVYKDINHWAYAIATFLSGGIMGIIWVARSLTHNGNKALCKCKNNKVRLHTNYKCYHKETITQQLPSYNDNQGYI